MGIEKLNREWGAVLKIRTWEVGTGELERALQRPGVTDVRTDPERARAIFGEPLTAAQAVDRIVSEVAERGDEALLHYAGKIDGVRLTAGELLVNPGELAAARQVVSPEFMEALQVAAGNIRAFHERQKQQSWLDLDTPGRILGQKVTPIGRVGLYVPAGTAPLVSSLLMTAIPAQVAGVPEVIVATPCDASKQVHASILAAADFLGIREVLRVGGAQAIAAMAFGTQTVKKVDKIAGPGNIFVTLAKKRVFGHVGIDMLAGPSEILVACDGEANPVLVAADMLSQAEHDAQAGVILVTTCEDLVPGVEAELERQISDLPRAAIARRSLSDWGRIIICRTLEEMAGIINICAPEHLELQVSDPFAMLPLIDNAGAVFLGSGSAEPLGDYVAGPNHVLPTNGTARFSSPLSVDDFVKKSSIIHLQGDAISKMGPAAVELARIEGLDAHANSVSRRLWSTGGRS